MTGANTTFDVNATLGIGGVYGMDFNEADGRLYFVQYNGARVGSMLPDGTDHQLELNSVGGNLAGALDLKFNPLTGHLGVVIAGGVLVREFDLATDSFVRQYNPPSTGQSNGIQGIDYQRVQTLIPEPASLGLLAAGGSLLLRRRRA
jgi:hypothetical protein